MWFVKKPPTPTISLVQVTSILNFCCPPSDGNHFDSSLFGEDFEADSRVSFLYLNAFLEYISIIVFSFKLFKHHTSEEFLKRSQNSPIGRKWANSYIHMRNDELRQGPIQVIGRIVEKVENFYYSITPIGYKQKCYYQRGVDTKFCVVWFANWESGQRNLYDVGRGGK